MSYDRQHIGYELKSKLKEEVNIIEISRWAYNIFSNFSANLENEDLEMLEYLFRMEDDPQFEYTKSELLELSKKLINNEKLAIQSVNELKRKRFRHD